MFCAACLRTCDGSIREPVGRNDALVVMCEPCARGTVKPVDVSPRARVRKDPRDARAAQIRANRDRLAAAGLCIYGEKHGPATRGKFCARCDAKNRGRNRARRRAA